MRLSEAQQTIDHAVAQLGSGPLNESRVVEHLHPLFSRTLARNERTNEIYLANHSLGRPLDLMSGVMQTALDGWYDQLDGVWGYWLQARELYRAQIARLMQWPQSDAIVPKSSAAQGLRAVLNALPSACPTVVSTRCEFDSIDFVLKAYAHKGRAKVRWVEPDELDMLQADSVIRSIDDQTDLVVVSMVCFVTGQAVVGIERIIEKAHACGALVVLDAYHAYGVLPIDFGSLDADFIISGNYKYTRGGAGACLLAIHPKHLQTRGAVPPADSLFPIDTGWFAKEQPFAYRREEQPAFAAGGDAWLEATPPVLTYFQALPGLMLCNAIGIERLRVYSLEQQQILIDSLMERGITPHLLEQRGAYILLDTPDGHTTIKQLKSAGVNADARPLPRSGSWVVRLCPDLLNTASELRQAADRIATVMNPA